MGVRNVWERKPSPGSLVVPAQDSRDSMSRVYVGGLPKDVEQRDIEDAFYKFGKLTNVWIARKPPGFAFLVRTRPCGLHRASSAGVCGADFACTRWCCEPFHSRILKLLCCCVCRSSWTLAMRPRL